MPECLAKHTVFQPSDDEWKCPQCGEGMKYFYTEEPLETAAEGCTKVHEEDGITCANCGLYWSGKEVTELMAKKANLVVCPCCKGKGMVPKEGT